MLLLKVSRFGVGMTDLSMCLLISHPHPCELREFYNEGFRSCGFITLSSVMKKFIERVIFFTNCYSVWYFM